MPGAIPSKKRDASAVAESADNIGIYDNPDSYPFDALDANRNLHFLTKLAALKVSASVVSLVSYSGEEEIFQSSGVIIQSNESRVVVLTTACLVRCRSGEYSVAPNIRVVVHLSDTQSFVGRIIICDFHYHLAAIEILSNTQVTTPSVCFLDDSLPVDPAHVQMLSENKSFGLRLHSKSSYLKPGDSVIAVGRHFRRPYTLMAAPGVFRPGSCNFDCKELFASTCRITRCGMGWPVINSLGDVIGISFYNVADNPFLPINVALTWWEQYNKHGKLRQPWLGMELGNLHNSKEGFLEKINRKFPNVLKGVVVNELTVDFTWAETAGVKVCDVITHFGGKPIQRVLELMKESWDKVRKVVEMVVVREDTDLPVHTSILVGEITPDKFYSWENMWNYVQ